MTQPVGNAAADASERRSIGPTSGRMALAICWAALVAIGGGLICGWLIVRYGSMGTIGLWGNGVLGGLIARRIAGRSRLLAGTLVVACIAALLMAETWWIHEEWNPQPTSWVEAMGLLPTFVKNDELSALMGLLFCGFGAHSAWTQLGRQYRLVAVEE